MKTTVSILTALALGAAATFVLADQGPRQGHGAFLERLKAADTNADGMISRDEAAALPHLLKHFDEIDANHDGQITLEELQAFHAKHAANHGAKLFQRLDTDGDGRISKAEALAAAAARFDAADTNHDGYLTPDEFRAGHKRARPAPQN